MSEGSNKFESLSALFGGLAFVGMLCTLSLQRQELSLQRDELSMTRQASQIQADAQMKGLLLNTVNVQLRENMERKAYLHNLYREHQSNFIYNNEEYARQWQKRKSEIDNAIREGDEESKTLQSRLRKIQTSLLPLYEKYSTNESSAPIEE